MTHPLLQPKAESKRCTNTRPHASHLYGKDVVDGGYRCPGVEVPPPIPKQCSSTTGHPEHQFGPLDKPFVCPGIAWTAAEWITRLEHLQSLQGKREVCFCDPGWPDRDCPVHFPENSWSEMLKREALWAMPVLIEAARGSEVEPGVEATRVNAIKDALIQIGSFSVTFPQHIYDLAHGRTA